MKGSVDDGSSGLLGGDGSLVVLHDSLDGESSATRLVLSAISSSYSAALTVERSKLL